jgi:AraC-like DNA-binding protein
MPPTPGEVAKLAQLSHTLILEAPSREKHAVPHRSPRRRLSPQAIEDLVARYTAGEKTPALSRAFGISESGVRDLLRADEVTLRGHAMTSEDAEQAVLLYARGLTITAVVAQIGYSHGTIRKVLSEHGIAIRAGPQGRRMV